MISAYLEYFAFNINKTYIIRLNQRCIYGVKAEKIYGKKIKLNNDFVKASKNLALDVELKI